MLQREINQINKIQINHINLFICCFAGFVDFMGWKATPGYFIIAIRCLFVSGFELISNRCDKCEKNVRKAPSCFLSAVCFLLSIGPLIL